MKTKVEPGEVVNIVLMCKKGNRGSECVRIQLTLAMQIMNGSVSQSRALSEPRADNYCADCDNSDHYHKLAKLLTETLRCFNTKEHQLSSADAVLLATGSAVYPNSVCSAQASEGVAGGHDSAGVRTQQSSHEKEKETCRGSVQRSQKSR